MKSLKLMLAVMAGFLLGAAFHPLQSRADGGSVSVKRASVGNSTGIYGSNVVGFSCTGSGSDTECYIASQ
jgi:hypothetical protein